MYNSNQKWKILKMIFYSIFSLFFILHSLECTNQIKYFKLGHFKKIRNIKLSKIQKIWKTWKKFFTKKKLKKKIIFKIFHFWLELYTQNHDQQFVSCLNFMIIYEKSMWNAHPLHTKAYKRHSLQLDTL